MKKIWACMLLLIMTTGFIPMPVNKQYDGKKYSFTYPDNWLPVMAAEDQGVDIFVYPPEDNDASFNENLNIISVHLNGNSTTLTQVSDSIKSEHKRMFTRLKYTTDQTLKGANGTYHEFVYSGTWNSKHVQIRQHILLKKGNLYLVTFTALLTTYSKYETGLNTILTSFRVK